MKEFYTIQDLIDMKIASRPTLLEKIKRGELRAINVGTKGRNNFYRFPRDEIVRVFKIDDLTVSEKILNEVVEIKKILNLKKDETDKEVL